MHCVNCVNAASDVLVVELTVLAPGPDEFAEPDRGFALECAACASTDVHGDPVVMVIARVG